MKLRYLSTLLLLLLFPSISHPLELTVKESGRSISLPVGEPLSITLAGNPTTGYIWELAEVERTVLAPDPEPLYVPDSSLTGAGGRYTFRLFPLKAGSTAVKLEYRRPWEKGVAPVQRFDLTVTVLPSTRTTVARYLSSAGKTAAASFDLGRNLVTVTLPDGRCVTLPSAPSASGARYSDGRESFWEHQGVGRFFKGEKLIFEGAVADEAQTISRLRFRSFDQADILKVRVVGKSTIHGEETLSPDGGHSLRSGGGNVVEVTLADGKILQLSVPEFPNRPLSCHWINAKLLYLELWFNPHNAAFWIYDLERRGLLTKELMDDGQLQDAITR
ncbi:MAG: protease inhibitor I42 family protein [Deltaproteobacteria bacterium]